jgi:hypothetical protein
MRRARERGTVLVTVLVILLLCITLSASLLTSNMSHNAEVNAKIQAERAFQLAEAGVDWAIVQVRANFGEAPDPATETRTFDASGSFEVSYLAGDACGRDLDGDGATDNVEQSDFTVVRSIGRSGDMAKSIEVVLRKQLVMPEINASILLNVGNAIVDLKGNSFLISGDDHDMTGSVDATLPVKAGISSPGNPDDIILQIDVNRQDQVVGVGGAPSVTLEPRIDLESLVQAVVQSGSVRLQPGTHTDANLGTPTPEGVESVYCEGDLHLSGNAVGAGIMVVDGDLKISGSLSWTGILIVRGSVDMVGGGGSKRVIGAVLVGEAVLGTDTALLLALGVSGTVDLLYSTAAIEMVNKRLAVVTMVSWRQVGVQ